MIRLATERDALAIANIYNHYVRESIATFEESEVSETEMLRRMHSTWDNKLIWLVAEDKGLIVGYAYASVWDVRSGYRHTVSVSVYLSPTHHRRGWATKLYQSLFQKLRDKQIRVIIGGIALPNSASVALHEKFGMKKVAHFEQVGLKFKRWIDVAYWQLAFEH